MPSVEPKDAKQPSAAPSAPERGAGGVPAIWARGLVKRYGDLVAVNGLDLTAEPGTCLGLLGPNGAGKTTTIEILEGLRAPDSGDVSILGRDWKRHGRKLRSLIGVQLQETKLTERLTVAETLRLFRSFYEDGRTVAEVLELVGLGEKQGTRYENLSGGQRQRLALGCALVNRPQLLFLDEPTTGLDPQGRRRVWEVIEEFKSAGGTVLLTTHYMDEAERLADQLVIIDHGRTIGTGTPRSLIASLGADGIVEIVAAPHGAPPRADALQALPGVLSVREQNAHWTLAVREFHETLPALIESLRAQRVELADLRTHRPTLEDLFVTLTGRQLRDE